MRFRAKFGIVDGWRIKAGPRRRKHQPAQKNGRDEHADHRAPPAIVLTTMKLGRASSSPAGRKRVRKRGFPMSRPGERRGHRPCRLVKRCGSCICQQSTPVVTGPGVRREDANYLIGYVDLCTAGFSTGFLASLRLCAVLISAIWVNACGKLPV